MGFAAAGKDGNASEAVLVAVFGGGGLICGREGAGDERVDTAGVAHGVAPTRPVPTRFADAAAPDCTAGKGLGLAAFPQLPCLLTAEREDCAVELFNFSTLLPPPPPFSIEAEAPGKAPLGPGRIG